MFVYTRETTTLLGRVSCPRDLERVAFLTEEVKSLQRSVGQAQRQSHVLSNTSTYPREYVDRVDELPDELDRLKTCLENIMATFLVNRALLSTITADGNVSQQSLAIATSHIAAACDRLETAEDNLVEIAENLSLLDKLIGTRDQEY